MALRKIEQLLGDRYAPITKEIGFLECTADSAAEGYVRWMRRIRKNTKLFVSKFEGSLEVGLQRLLPLGTLASRYLFVPTTGRWCAFFDNGWRGTDSPGAMSVLAQAYCHCRAMRVVWVPHTHRKKGSEWFGSYGATMWEVYSPHEVNIHNTERSIAAANDGGRWVFSQNGTPYKFEQLNQYKGKKVRDKFSPELLDNYLRHFGVKAFDSEFYCPAGKKMFLVEVPSHVTKDGDEYSLQDVQRWRFGPRQVGTRSAALPKRLR